MISGFIFGVDLDGVCGDYTKAFKEVVAADRGISPDELPDNRSWEFTEWGITDADFGRLHRLAVLQHRIFLHMDPLPGVAEALWRLSDAGIWIRIITHRLAVNWGHSVAVSDTVSWLDRIGIPYRDICFLGAKPQVEADLYVDDAVHNVEALRAHGNEVIVFDAPYNQYIAGPRVKSWVELEAVALEAASRAGHPIQGRLDGLNDIERPIDRLGSKLDDDFSSPPVV